MAKARLLRQYLADYNREVKGANKDYKEQYATYQGATNEYNAFISAMNAGQAVGIAEFAPGAWARTSGGQLLDTNKHGNSQTAGSLYSSAEEYQTAVQNSGSLGWTERGWVRNPDGTATLYRPDENGQVKPSEFRAEQGAYRIAKYNGPDAPTQEAPKAPTFTVNQLEEMANPSNSAAEINRAQAFGYTGKSALVAERDPTKNSAFANLGGDDPNQLKDRGVLARAIAGEI